jgi:hypothetical protein
MTDESRGTTAHPLCHWHDEDIRKMKEEAQEMDQTLRLLSARIPDKFPEIFAVLVADVANIKRALESQYVSRAEFAPIKAIVYGLAALILLGVGGAIVRLVVIK